MPGNPSFYFTLFKKFQVLNHVPSATVHGAAVPTGGFNLADPSAGNGVFGSVNLGTPLTAGDFSPANNPLWAVLNSRAMGNGGFVQVTIPGGAQAGTQWPTMPPGTPMAWTEFQLNPPSSKLVDVFASWITGGQVNDVPAGVIGQRPPTFAGPDAGVVLFVCSMPGDQGVRPGVPPDFWATSLIFLVDPQTGGVVTPTTLTGASEYYLTAVIGNRGNTNAGRFISHPPALEVAASVMVWNTVVSPGVQLPSLANLDSTAMDGIYEQYFLRSGEYDVVGFRMSVQSVYDGVIAALTDAVNNGGINLGGLTPEAWVKAQPAHLCAKVAIREQGTAFPNFGDSPDQDRRLAQKNLAPFDINLAVVSPDPNIIWKNFVVGQPLFMRIDRGEGRNILTLDARLSERIRLYLAVPTDTFERFFKKGPGAIRGYKVVSHQELCEGRLGERAKPFPEAVVLQFGGGANAIEIPALPEKHYLGMSLGLEYSVKNLKPGPVGEVKMVHETALPILAPTTRCFEVAQKVVGGFTLRITATDPHRGFKGERVDYPDF